MTTSVSIIPTALWATVLMTAISQDKEITVARLRTGLLEDISKIDVSDAVTPERAWVSTICSWYRMTTSVGRLYIKPEGTGGLFRLSRQSGPQPFLHHTETGEDNDRRVREELAQKYYAMAETKPDLKVDIFGAVRQEVDLNRIQQVTVFTCKSGECLCAVTIDGADKLQPRSVGTATMATNVGGPDKNSYKQHLAASLFADILQKGQTMSSKLHQEKQVEATEVKQETAILRR